MLNDCADIYLNPGVNKAHIYKQSQFNPQINIFGTLDRGRHRQKRKVYGQVLSDRSLRIFEPKMNEDIDIFLKQLLNTQGKVVNMSPACERLATDIAGQLAFGQPLHTQVKAKNRLFPRAMVSMNAVVSLFSKLSPACLSSLLGLRVLTASHWPGHLFSIIWPIASRLNKKNARAFGQAVQGIIQSRMALAKDAKHDFYSMVAGDMNTKEGLRQSELWAEAIFFLPAGKIVIYLFRLPVWAHFVPRILASPPSPSNPQ